MNLLVVVDMQNDFVTGALGTPEAEAIVEPVKAKIKECRDAGYDVIFTQDTHLSDYLSTHEGKLLPVPHCLFGDSGWDFVNGIGIERRGEFVVRKHTFGFDEWPGFIERNYWASPDTIEIVGLCTDICVISNALILRANYPESNIIVDSRCCAGTTPEKHEAALQVMESCQIIVRR